ncbi:Lipase, GDSL [Artemisia annua]|uniref:Lipase, GDSL n=1 Tax=Artemisia annua TaxID=35608 RepID=A0A2U1PIV6_ARTAN|nr:Lipase, GDSL [Artemisia annua]
MCSFVRLCWWCCGCHKGLVTFKVVHDACLCVCDFFCKWSAKNVKKLVRILSWFQDVSGLKVDLSKSRLYGIGVNTSKQQDGWRWKLNPNGTFTVNNLSKLIDVAILGFNVMSCKVDWNLFVPRKVNICILRAMNRLPTLANLLLRGLPISSSLCPLCGLE